MYNITFLFFLSLAGWLRSTLVMALLLTPFLSVAQELSTGPITNKISLKDSARVMQLIEQSQDYQFSDHPRAVTMIDTALDIASAYNFGYGIGNSYIAYSIYASNLGDYAQADSFLLKAYPYCYFAAQSGAAKLLALWYENAGSLGAYQSNYKKALALYYAGLRVVDRYGIDSVNPERKISIYNSIGSLLAYTERNEKALYYLKNAEKRAIAQHQEKQLVPVYTNMGICYAKGKDWTKAHYYYSKAIALSQKYNNIKVLQIAYLALGNTYNKQNNYDSALFYIKKAILVSDKTGPYHAKIVPYLTLSAAYLNKKSYLLALQYAKVALKLSERQKDFHNIIYANATLAKVYEGQEQWHPAFQHLYTYVILQDSLTKKNTDEDMNRLEARYRVAEKDKSIAEQALAINKQKSALKEKNFWIAGICLSTLLLITFFIAFFKNYNHKKKLEIKNMEMQRLKAMLDGDEKERRRIATELHDGINAQLLAVKLGLNTALDDRQDPLLQTADIRRSLQYLQEAMQDLRQTAHNMMPDSMKGGLTKAIDSFCQKISLNGHTEVIFQKYGDTEPSDDLVKRSIFRIVQELVQNAVKYARASYVLVQFNFEKDFTGITVQDDGIGFEVGSEYLGKGLQSIQERVAAFTGTMEITSNGQQGTTIYIELKDVLN